MTNVEKKEGTGKKTGKPYTMYIVWWGKLNASTFDVPTGQLAEELMARRVPVEAELRPKKVQADRYELLQLREWQVI